MTQTYSNLDQYSDILANNAKNASKNLRTLTAEKRSAVLNLVAKTHPREEAGNSGRQQD
jgi:hypothetical protein